MRSRMGVVSVKQAAEFLGLHEQTVREYLRAGRIKAQRIGRVYVIEERDLRAFLAKPRKPGRPRKDVTK
jgi:excisionase family DNA binding protein